MLITIMIIYMKYIDIYMIIYMVTYRWLYIYIYIIVNLIIHIYTHKLCIHKNDYVYYKYDCVYINMYILQI